MNEAASSQDPPASLLRRAVYLLLLSILFFTTYNSANCHAASLPHVGSLVMAWEKRIPFLPWTIVPYWSIDLFYGASLIFASRRLELNRHALRLLCVQVLCVSCFVIFPLKFSFPKPPLTGLFAVWFDSLALFDKPFNQAPSLHIALLVILWAWFERRTHGLWRVLVHGWSLLIGLSVLTTYQQIGRAHV